jgi:hypothetical protein
VSTPLSGPGLPSDKLVAPMNAPGSGQLGYGVQPGVSNQVVLAQYVIIFGTNGGLFIYAGSPGPGNPPIYSISNSDSDPYGNAVFPGLVAGANGTNQVIIQTSGSIASIFFPSSATSSFADAEILAVNSNGGVELNLISSSDSANPGATSDRVALALFDNLAGSGSARWAAGYFDASGAFHFQIAGDNTGVQLGPVAGMNATHPGTGTSSANPAVAETWQAATLLNGWTGAGGGINGFRYRIAPWGTHLEIEADIINTTATGNSICFTLPAGYRPTQVSQNFPAAWNNVAASNSPSVPWVNVAATGNVQVTGLEAANKEVFFHLFVPLT